MGVGVGVEIGMGVTVGSRVGVGAIVGSGLGVAVGEGVGVGRGATEGVEISESCIDTSASPAAGASGVGSGLEDMHPIIPRNNSDPLSPATRPRTADMAAFLQLVSRLLDRREGQTY